MENYNLKILEFNREDNILNIGVRVKGPYDPAVRAPKIAVIFDNGKETRRLPILLQAYFPAESLETCTVFAKYGYNLDYLFFETPENKKIEIWFEYTYGDTIIDRIPFFISSDVKLDEDDMYHITCSEDSKRFVLKRTADFKETPAISVFTDLVQSIINELWGLILIILAAGLLPLFLVEGLLYQFGCVKDVPKHKNEGKLKALYHVRWRLNSFTRKSFGITSAKEKVLDAVYKFACIMPVKQNRIVFISNRRSDLTGNFQFVYDILKSDKSLDIRFVLDDRGIKTMSFTNVARYGRYLATSKIILVDDYAGLIYRIHRRKGTTMMQLWHACGAFKTFGYSRLGKKGGQAQNSRGHRNYDYAIVSSQEISKFYSEGFGLSLEKSVATGIPRTDVFFNASYKKILQESFYKNRPHLRDKKILLFAPTFRGNGKMSGFYPVDKFDVVKLYEELGKEYAIVIKHHPFVKDRNEIPAEYKDYIIDMSDSSELNDLLFVTDLLVTDYSSVIFEAALLDIPMLFYAYDLQRYIATRGFYYEYDKFVPGKIVYSFSQVVEAVKHNDFEQEKILPFKTRFFDHLDGKSSQRTVDLIYQSLKK